ncbi:outer membrane lipid asymmetry maintenance protein MlaD [Pseudooceanicola sp. 200-1SW]|uniref:outer membrane lipid asymmetry maintenance protein MlaD n=1 Tax=Pseudooceanicola sp. 200-1SW TaxID=3425949 RepID=UPI003D7F56B7
MSQNRLEILTGAVVLLIAAAFLAYGSRVVDLGGAGSSAYPLSASFRSAEGVSVGTDVRLAGVRVGTVTALELDPATFRATVDFTLRDGVEIPDDSQVAISSEGLLGGNYVEILPGGSPFNYAAGDEILDTQSSVSLISLLLQFVAGDSEE